MDCNEINLNVLSPAFIIGEQIQFLTSVKDCRGDVVDSAFSRVGLIARDPCSLSFVICAS